MAVNEINEDDLPYLNCIHICIILLPYLYDFLYIFCITLFLYNTSNPERENHSAKTFTWYCRNNS